MKKIILITLLSTIIISCQKSKLDIHKKKVNTFLVKNENATNFKLVLDTISSFKWDEMIVAGPYTDLQDITGYDFNDFSNEIKHYDRFVLIGFINNKKGVKYFEINRSLISVNIFDANNNKDYRIYKKSESNLLISK